MKPAVPSTSQEDPHEVPVLTLINEIKDKRISPKGLSTEDRRRCVEFLRAEGYSIAETAQILGRNERTIRRDIDHIQESHALAPDPRFAERMIGQLAHEAEVSIARLRRIAREGSCSGMERLMAEGMAWKTFREFFEKLQSVGYLPRVPTGVVAEVYQRLDAEPIAAYDQLAKELQEVVEVSKATGRLTTEQADRCMALQEEVERGRMSVRLDRLKEDIKEQEP